MPKAEKLDTKDLDAEDLKALDEVGKKGYYHDRPKSEPTSYGPTKIDEAGKKKDGKRAEFDEFQAKWDKFDGLDEDSAAAGLKETSSGRSKKVEKPRSKEKLERLRKAKEEGGKFQQQCIGCTCLIFMMGAGLGSTLLTMWSAMMGNGITYLDVDNTAELKSVLFGGDPWLIYCVDESTEKYPLPKILEESAWDLQSSIGVKTGVLNCYKETESGRSVANRFGYSQSPPLSFAIANGDKPRLVNVIGVKDSEGLAKKIKPILEVVEVKIDQIQKWPKHCANKKTCLVIGHKNKDSLADAMQIFKPLLTKHRGVKVVTIDTSFWGLKLGEPIMQKRPEKEKDDKSVDVVCIAKRDNSIDLGPNETHVGTFLSTPISILDISTADAFMQSCSQQSDMVVLGVEPKIGVKEKKKPKPKAPTRSQGGDDAGEASGEADGKEGSFKTADELKAEHKARQTTTTTTEEDSFGAADDDDEYEEVDLDML